MSESKPRDPHRIHARHEIHSEGIEGFTWGSGFSINWTANAKSSGATLTAVLNAVKNRLEFCSSNGKNYNEVLKHVEAAIKALDE